MKADWRIGGLRLPELCGAGSGGARRSEGIESTNGAPRGRCYGRERRKQYTYHDYWSTVLWPCGYGDCEKFTNPPTSKTADPDSMSTEKHGERRCRG